MLKYVFWVLAAGIIFYIISQNIVVAREVAYNLDFKNSISPDITGWYPESRVFFDSENNIMQLLGEPVYLQAYIPWRGQSVLVKGSWSEYQPGLRLGLRQQDGTWQFSDILSADFELPFDMQSAQIKQNKIEFILSAPDLSQPLMLENNWQIILSR